MRAYASISPMFWTRGSGKRLRGDAHAQVVALYLMSSPATSMIGIFHLALPTLCHETGLSFEEASKGLQRCSEEGLVFWDEEEELVFVPALAKHQIGEELKERDHKVKGVAKALAPFKGHRFYSMFVERYADCYRLREEEQEAPSRPLTRDDVPVMSCPAPVSSPGSGSDPQVDTALLPPPPRDSKVLAEAALRDPMSASLRLPLVQDWPEVAAVCDAFAATYGRQDRPRHQGDPRARAILGRLAAGYTVAQLEAAVRGSKFADYIADNPANQALVTILRDDSQVDKFSALTAPSGRQRKAAVPPQRQPDSGTYSPLSKVERIQ